VILAETHGYSTVATRSPLTPLKMRVIGGRIDMGSWDRGVRYDSRPKNLVAGIQCQGRHQESYA
jgi:hypothetical protein